MSMKFLFLSLVMMFTLAGCGGGGSSSSGVDPESVAGSETVDNGGTAPADTAPENLPVEVPENPAVDAPGIPPVTAPENPPVENIAKEIVLAWNESLGAGGQPNENVVGYKIYYGNASGQYSSVVTVNKATSATISLIPGGYYFALTAFDAAGNESGYSEEINTTL